MRVRARVCVQEQQTAPDRETKMLNVLAAVVSFMYTSAWIFPVLILFGGLVTYVRDLKEPVKEAPGSEGIQSYGMGKGVCVLCTRVCGYRSEGLTRVCALVLFRFTQGVSRTGTRVCVPRVW